MTDETRPRSPRWSGLSVAGLLVVAPFVLFHRLVVRLTEAAFAAVDWYRAREDRSGTGGV